MKFVDSFDTTLNNGSYGMCTDGTFIYIAMEEQPARVLKVNPSTMSVIASWVGTATQRWAEDLCYLGGFIFVSLDDADGAGYGGMVKLNPVTMLQVNAWTGAPCNRMTTEGTYIYVTIADAPGAVYKIDPSTMGQNGGYTHEDNTWNYPWSITNDGTYFYASGQYQSGTEYFSRILKIQMSDMSYIGDYNGRSNYQMLNGVVASGGDSVGTFSNDKGTQLGHFFYSGSNLVVTSPGFVDIVMVGGGGGGANTGSGGGGGGVIERRSMYLEIGVHPITIGAGGIGGSSQAAPGENGGNTTFAGLTAYGGGGGVSHGGGAGVAGGSGSGGAMNIAGSPAQGGASILGQGSAGGAGYVDAGWIGGNGGGGGYSEVGADGTEEGGGNGGAGFTHSWYYDQQYAGGGGGGEVNGNSGGQASFGGGWAWQNGPGYDGNTIGGGGGGGSYNGGVYENGGNGYPGFLMISYSPVVYSDASPQGLLYKNGYLYAGFSGNLLDDSIGRISKIDVLDMSEVNSTPTVKELSYPVTIVSVGSLLYISSDDNTGGLVEVSPTSMGILEVAVPLLNQDLPTVVYLEPYLYSIDWWGNFLKISREKVFQSGISSKVMGLDAEADSGSIFDRQIENTLSMPSSIFPGRGREFFACLGQFAIKNLANHKVLPAAIGISSFVAKGISKIISTVIGQIALWTKGISRTIEAYIGLAIDALEVLSDRGSIWIYSITTRMGVISVKARILTINLIPQAFIGLKGYRAIGRVITFSSLLGFLASIPIGRFKIFISKLGIITSKFKELNKVRITRLGMRPTIHKSRHIFRVLRNWIGSKITGSQIKIPFVMLPPPSPPNPPGLPAVPTPSTGQVGVKIYYSGGGTPEQWIAETARVKVKLMDVISGRSRMAEIQISNPRNTKDVYYTPYKRIRLVDYVTGQTILLGRVTASDSGWDKDLGLVLTLKVMDYMVELTTRYVSTSYNNLTRRDIISQIVSGHTTPGTIGQIIATGTSAELVSKDYVNSQKKASQAIEEVALEDSVTAISGTSSGMIVGYMTYSSFSHLHSFDLSRLTHLIWQGVKVSAADNAALICGDSGYDISQLTDVVTAGHGAGNSVLACLIAAWTGGDSDFNTLIVDSGLRTDLVNNLVDLVATYDLDGIDVDSENYANHADYGDFLHELHTAMHSAGKLVTIAGNGYIPDIDVADAGYVDYINVMAYDLSQGQGYPYHSILTESAAAITTWMSAGFSVGKLVMGVPAYGRDNADGYYPYREIVADYNPTNSQNQVDANVPGAIIWWSGVDLTIQKALWAKGAGCAGMMVYELGTDLWNDSRSIVRSIYDSLQTTISEGTVSGCDYRVDDSDNPIFEYFVRGTKPAGGSANGLTISLTDPVGDQTKRMLSDYNFSKQPAEVITRIVVRGQDANGVKMERTATNSDLLATYGIQTEYVDTVYGASTGEYLQTRANELRNVFGHEVKRGKCKILGYPVYKVGGVYQNVRAGDVVRIKNTLQSVDADYVVVSIEYEEPPSITSLELLDAATYGRDIPKALPKPALSAADIGDLPSPGSPATATLVDHAIMWYIPGVLTNTSYGAAIPVPFNFQITEVVGYVITPCVGGLIIANIYINDSYSIFDTYGYLGIQQNVNSGVSYPVYTYLAKDSVLTLYVEVVGQTVPGSDLTVEVRGRAV
jgi:hypothetical protein